MHPRVTYVSRHVTKIEPCSDLLKIWLEESERAAKHQHDISDPHLRAMVKPERDEVLVSAGNWTARNQYMETLKSLSASLSSNPEKADFYRRLADAMQLPDKDTWREDVEIVLHSGPT